MINQAKNQTVPTLNQQHLTSECRNLVQEQHPTLALLHESNASFAILMLAPSLQEKQRR